MVEDIRPLYQDAASYDLLNSKQDDLPFWAEACRRYQPSAVLELAVGTGRVAIPLARQGVEQGFSVTGLDITTEMLARAKEKLVTEPPEVRAALTLVEGDIRRHRFERRFNLAFIAFNAILHLLNLEDRLEAFGCAYDNLAHGGRLIVDVFSFSPSVLVLAQAQEPVARLELVQDVEAGELGQRLVRSIAQRYDETTQTMRGQGFVETYRQGRSQSKRVEDVACHIYFPEELRLLLLQSGFTVESVFGDYDWSPYAAGSPRMIYVGRRE